MLAYAILYFDLEKILEGRVHSSLLFHQKLSLRMHFLWIFIVLALPALSWSESWVIVANGSEIDATELKKSLQDRRVIALDGAADRFKELQMHPDVILGDFDSIQDPAYWGIVKTFSAIDESSLSYMGQSSVVIVPAKDQDRTDLEKAILHCDQSKADSILIVQAMGGRMDHSLGNLGLLRKYHRLYRPIVIETSQEQIFYLHDQRAIVHGGAGGVCAIMGYPHAEMTTQGLAYNGNSYSLELGFQESVCNQLIAEEAHILIEGEALVILPKSAVVTITQAHEDLQTISKIQQVLKQACESKHPVTIRKIEGGITNENYVVDAQGSSYFVRCGGSQTEPLGVYLENEWIVTSLVSQAKLAPELRLYVPEEKVMVSSFVKEARSIDMRQLYAQERLCERLRRLHSLDVIFPTLFCPFSCIENYVQTLQRVNGTVPAVFSEIITPAIASMRPALEASFTKAPCHLDLHRGNLIDNGKDLYLIDWEYAGMGDPLFDLAVLTSVELFSDAEMKSLLRTYLQREPTEEETEGFHKRRILADARWAVWSYLQAEISPIEAPFKDRGDRYVRECLSRIGKMSPPSTP